MLRRRITASYGDCKTTPKANLVHRVQARLPDATFEDQEYFHIHQPYVDRAVAQSVRYWYENVDDLSNVVETIEEFYKEKLIEGSDLIKLQPDYEIMYGSDDSQSENGYVVLSHHTDRMKKGELEQLIENAGFNDGSSPVSLEPREYGFLRYPDVTNPIGVVLKYWFESMDENEVREALTSIVGQMRPQTEDVGKIIFARDIQS